MLRFKTMQGFRVEGAEAGWDCHGLPVELGVQRELGLASADDVRAYGVARFNARCRASVDRFEADWRRVTTRMGFWLDLDRPYKTMDASYVDAVWGAFATLFERGLVYKVRPPTTPPLPLTNQARKVTPYCPATGATYSSHEVAQGYKTVTDTAAYVAFPTDGDGPTLLAWTTTPWTLLANRALAVDPALEYVEVDVPAPPGACGEPACFCSRFDATPYKPRLCMCTHGAAAHAPAWRRVVVAAALAPADASAPVRRLRGADLVGLTYTFAGGQRRVVAADWVSADTGTGVVHVAPLYGEDDYNLLSSSEDSELSEEQHTVGLDGRFVPGTHPALDGREAMASNALVLSLLRDDVLRTEPVEHQYPHCWRTGERLMYYAQDSWFVRTTALRDALLAADARVAWAGGVGAARFTSFLEGVRDWAVSRARFWGTPLPVWMCQRCGAHRCVRSRAELQDPAVDPHLPLPAAAAPRRCPACAAEGALRHEPFVLDCWFDSGCAPFARGGGAAAPVDWVCEGMDQTRGWFYTLLVLAVGTRADGEPAYRRVLPLGLLTDERGHKMSKSKGNAVDPEALFAAHGADAVRWALVAAGAAWQSSRFVPGDVAAAEGFFYKLWNVGRFYRVVASGGGDATTALDRWARSLMARLAAEVTADLEASNFHLALERLRRVLTNDVSQWYVRLSRARFRPGGDGGDAGTLRHVLDVAARLLAPVAPHVAEALFPDDGASVHHAPWPAARPGDRDEALEAGMARLREAVEAARKLRVGRPGRLAVPEAWVVGVAPELLPLFAAEVNAAAVRAVPELPAHVRRTRLELDRRALGRRCGRDTPAVLAALADAQELPAQVLGHALSEATDVLARATTAAPGFAVGDGVALDMRETPEALSQFKVRELATAVKRLRRAAGFELLEPCRVEVRGSLTEGEWAGLLESVRGVSDGSVLLPSGGGVPEVVSVSRCSA